MIDLDVRLSGPLFTGAAQDALDQFLTAAEQAVAQEGVDEVGTQLDRVLRNPTGYYESQIQVDRAQGDRVVTDGGVIYGPWLAGVSSLNQTTSFKGYQHWQRATRVLDSKAERIAQRELPPFLARMQ